MNGPKSFSPSDSLSGLHGPNEVYHPNIILDIASYSNIVLLRNRVLSLKIASSLKSQYSSSSFPRTKSLSFALTLSPPPNAFSSSASKASFPISDTTAFVKSFLFVPPGLQLEEVTESVVLPGSNIVVGPYAGDAKIKEVEFVKSSGRAKDCPRDDRPELAIHVLVKWGTEELANFYNFCLNVTP